MNDLRIGNVNVDGSATRQWIVGSFMPENDIRNTEHVEVKWGNHAKGDAREEWAKDETRTTLAILISGRFALEFPDNTVELIKQGDFVMWGSGTDHRWEAKEDSVFLTIRWPSSPRFIAITGQEASGKDSIAEHLAKLGYLHIAAGDVLRKRARAAGHKDPIPRSVLSQIGDAMKQEFGPSFITQSSIKRYEEQKAQFTAGLVISGLRRAGELSAFKAQGAVALWVEADDDKRFSNQLRRARGDQQDRATFLERSKLEYFGATDGGADGVNLQAIEAMADFKVRNDGTLEDLLAKADDALRISK